MLHQFSFPRWEATHTAEPWDQQAHSRLWQWLADHSNTKSKFYPHKTSKTKRNQTCIFRLKPAFTQSRARFLFQAHMFEDFLWHNDRLHPLKVTIQLPSLASGSPFCGCVCEGPHRAGSAYLMHSVKKQLQSWRVMEDLFYICFCKKDHLF